MATPNVGRNEISAEDRNRIIELLTSGPNYISEESVWISEEAVWPSIISAIELYRSYFLNYSGLEASLQWGYLLEKVITYWRRINPDMRIRRLFGIIAIAPGPPEPKCSNPRFFKFCRMLADILAGEDSRFAQRIYIPIFETWPYIKFGNFRNAISERWVDACGNTVFSKTGPMSWMGQWEQSAVLARLAEYKHRYQLSALDVLLMKLEVLWFEHRKSRPDETTREIHLFISFISKVADIASHNQISQHTLITMCTDERERQNASDARNDLQRRISAGKAIAKKLSMTL